jgi:hypothetical protein
LEAENLVLRHQLNVLRRKSPKRVALSGIDRLLLVGLYRLAPGVLDALKIIRPETLLRWHRAGFPSLLALEIPTTGDLSLCAWWGFLFPRRKRCGATAEPSQIR